MVLPASAVTDSGNNQTGLIHSDPSHACKASMALAA